MKAIATGACVTDVEQNRYAHRDENVPTNKIMYKRRFNFRVTVFVDLDSSRVSFSYGQLHQGATSAISLRCKASGACPWMELPVWQWNSSGVNIKKNIYTWVKPVFMHSEWYFRKLANKNNENVSLIPYLPTLFMNLNNNNIFEPSRIRVGGSLTIIKLNTLNKNNWSLRMSLNNPLLLVI